MKYLQENYVKYGMLMVLITIGCLAAMQLSGQNKSYDPHSPLFFFYQFVAPLIVWYLGIREKKKLQKDKLTFMQGFIEGFKISVVFAVVSPFVFLIYYTLVNPQIVESLKHGYHTENTATVIGLDMTAQLVSSMMFGVIFSVIVSLFLKSKSKQK